MLYKKCQIIVLIPIFLFHVVTSFAQQRDSRVREYLSPIRIVWQQESQLIQGAEYLLRSGHGQANLVNNELCKLSSTGQQHPAILSISERNCKAAYKLSPVCQPHMLLLLFVFA